MSNTTPRKKINNSDEKLQVIINHIKDILIEAELNGMFTYVSSQAYDILGYKPEELIGINGFSFIHPEDLPNLASKVKKLTNEGGPLSAEYRVLHKDGHYVHISAKGAIVKEKGNIKLIAILRDISIQKEIEQKLKESEEKYRTLFDNSPQAVGLINTKGIVIQGNSNIEKIFGYKNEEFIGKNFRKFPLFSKEDNAIVFDSLNKLSKGELPEPQELRLHRKDGSIIWVSMQSSIVKLKNETLFQIITQDISKIKVVEKKLEEQNKELQELNLLKTEFLGRASHELKTPLAAIKGYADLVIRAHTESLKPGVITMLESIQSGCSRLEDIIHKLIESSKLETSKIELNTTEGDLISIIRLCLNDVQSLIRMRNLTIKFDGTDFITTKFNKEQIREVILNLLNNAINYSPPLGIIAINSEIKDNTIIISIKDRGIGFSEDDKKNLFQKFRKIPRENQEFDVISGGSGLGLYISKKIIELHGGDIWVESEGRNKGSTFYFTLPLI